MVEMIEPAFLSAGQIKDIESQDRARVIALLRAQEKKAREAPPPIVGVRPTKSESRLRDRKDAIATASARVARELEKGTGPVPRGVALVIARATFPDSKSSELKSKFGSSRQRVKASRAIREKRMTDEELIQERGGFDRGVTVEQRERFVASGLSKQARPEEVQRARVSQVRKGNLILRSVEGGVGRVERGTIGGTKVVFVKPKQKPPKDLPRLPLGFSRDREGNLILVREGGKRGQIAKQIFKELGAPERKVVAQIDFGREKKIIFVKGGRLFPDTPGTEKVIVPQLGFGTGKTEISRRSIITEKQVEIQSAEQAKFLRFPTTQDGEAISFPTVFTVQEDIGGGVRPRESVFDIVKKKKGPVFEALNVKGVALSKGSLADVPLSPGSTVKGIQNIGKILGGVGPKVESLGRVVKETLRAPSDKSTFGGRAAEGFKISPGGRGFERVAVSTEVFGQFLTAEGRIAQEKPVTFGAGEAAGLGVAFGVFRAVRKVAQASKVAKSSKLVAGSLSAVKGLEFGVGGVLAGSFVVATGVSTFASERPGETLAQATNQLIGFGVGFKAGGALTTGVVRGAKGVGKIGSLVVDKTTVFVPTGRESPDGSIQTVRVPIGTEGLVKGFQSITDVSLGRRGSFRGGRISTPKKTLRQRKPLSKAGLRDPGKSARQRAPKFEVERSGRVVGDRSVPVETRAMRGQARKDLKTVRELVVTEVLKTEISIIQPKQFAFKSKGDSFALVVEKPVVRRVTKRTGIFIPTGLEGVPLGAINIIKPLNTKAVVFSEVLGKGKRVFRGREPPKKLIIRREIDLTKKKKPKTKSIITIKDRSVEERFLDKNPMLKLEALRRRTSNKLGELQALPIILSAKAPKKKSKLVTVVEPKPKLRTVRDVTTTFLESAKVEGGSPFTKGRNVLSGKPAKVRRGVVVDVDEVGVPELFKRFRADVSGQFVRGSPEARKAATLERLRGLRDVREEQVRGQLPALSSTREPSLFGKVSDVPKIEVKRVGELVDTKSKVGELSKVKKATDLVRKSDVVTSNINKVLSSSALAVGLRSALGLSQASLLATDTLQKQSLLLQQDTVSRLEQKQKQAQQQVQASLLVQAQTTGLATTPRQPTKQRRRSGLVTGRGPLIPRLPLRGVTVTTEPPRTPPPGLFELPEFGGLGAPGFRVFVKRGGAFVLEKDTALTRRQALELGASIVDTTPSQQFRIEETGEKVKGTGREPSTLRVKSLLRKFTSKEEGLFQEKQANLIDTAGELRDITLKGIRASAQSRKQLRRLRI